MSDKDIEAKLSFLRQDAADALRLYVNTVGPPAQVNVAALLYLHAHTIYTLACLEAKQSEILPYIDLPKGE